MESDEYLEDLFRERYKFEADQDENVARTLPFFPASIAILLTFLVYAGQHAIHTSAPWTWLIVALLGGAVACVLGALGFLALAVWPRSYRLLPPETELEQYAQGLEAYYVAQGRSGADAIPDLRRLVVAELAAAVVNNRAHNSRKVLARNQAFGLLIAAIAAVLFAGITIFLADGDHALRLSGRSEVGAENDTESGKASGSAAREAEPAPGALRDRGRQAPVRLGEAPGGQPGAAEVTEKPASHKPAPSPSPAPAVSKPQPPQHQMLRKSEGGTGPLKRID